MLQKKKLNLTFLIVLFCSMMAFTGCSSDDDSSAAGSAADINGTGIVWKPVSEGDGKLVVLIPSSYSKVAVAVVSTDGDTVDTGRYVGRTNGSRPTYRFSKPGSGYPSPCVLQVGTAYYSIPSSASRYN